MGQWQNKFKSISTLNNNREYETGDFDTKETYNIPINNTQYLFNLLKNHPYVYRILKGDRLQFDYFEPVENSTDGQTVVQKTVLIDINDLNGVSKNKIGFVTLRSSSGSLTSEQVTDVMKTLCIIEYNGNYYFNVTDITENNIFNRTFVSQVRTVDVNNGEYVKLVQDSIVVTCDTAYTGTYSYIENTKVETYTKSQLDALIPTALSQLTGDSTHRLVTDAEKTTWNNKQDEIADLDEIRAGASVNEATLYHLGAFDSVDGNRITRQTGYLNFDVNDTANWQKETHTNIIRYKTNKTIYIEVASNINNGGDIGDVVPTANGYFLNSNRIYVYAKDNDFSNIVNGVFQYKLATPYYEDIIENQPLTTLDQNGSQWLREEWEKGLNLGSFPDRTGRWWVTVQQDLTDFINQLPNGTYNISADCTPLSVDSGFTVTNCFFLLQVTGGQYTGDGVLKSVGDFTALNQTKRGALTFEKQSYTNYSFRLWGFGNHNGGNHGQGKVSNIMLNEGDHAYPYQEYKGAIVREKDIEPVLLWENANPSAEQDSFTVTNNNIPNYKYTIIEYKFHKDTGAKQYLKVKTPQETQGEGGTGIILQHCDFNNEFRIVQRKIGLGFNSLNHNYEFDVWDTIASDDAVDNSILIVTALYGTNML